MQMMKNFFRGDGGPVTGDDFFGRKSLMQMLERLTLSGASVILIGERRIGKTSVLHEFRRRYLSANDKTSQEITRPVLINTYGFIARSEDKQWLAKEISRELITWSEQQPSKVSQIIRKSLKPESDHIDLIRCLRRIREDDLQIILLFDEVDSALVDGPPETAGLIRAIATEGHLTILATSYLHPAQLEVESMFGSPWFNFFHFHYLSLFNDEEALELLTVLSEKSGRRFSQKECLFLQDVFGNFPYYLQLAGWRVFENAEYLTCPDEQREKVLMLSVQDISDRLRYVWPHSIQYLPSEIRDSLLEIAHHRRAPNKQHLSILVERGLVIEKDGKYRVYSRAFEEYLKQLPEKSVLERAKESKALETLASLGKTALDTALKKAIEVAAEKYLGGP